MEKNFVVRDTRRKEKFQIDDEYLNGYAKLCGTNATLVYLCLCRHADYHTQECFPSVKMMADKLGISRDSVMTGIKNLLEWNIILKERVRNPNNAKWINNSYTLLDKSVWKEKPSRFEQPGIAKSEIEASQVGNKGKSQVAVVDCKDTHKDKDTHIILATTEVVADKTNEIIELFKEINPSYERFFSNKTQREVIKRLLSKYTQDQIMRLIKIAKIANQNKYAPITTTPLQLESNIAKLVYWSQKNNKNNVAII